MSKTTIDKSSRMSAAPSASLKRSEILAQELPRRTDLASLISSAKESLALQSLAKLPTGYRATVDYREQGKLGIHVGEHGTIILNFTSRNAAATYILEPLCKSSSDTDYATHRTISIVTHDSPTVPPVEDLLTALGESFGRHDRKYGDVLFHRSEGSTPNILKQN